MATRNRTFLFKKYRDALKSVRAPSSLASSSSRGGAVIELTNAGLLKQNSSYAPLSTEDPGTSSYVSSIFHLFFFSCIYEIRISISNSNYLFVDRFIRF